MLFLPLAAMHQQLTLFDLPEPRRARFNLFFAVLPDPRSAAQIATLAATIREKHGLRGALRPVSHLHVSLHSLGSVDVSERWLQIVGQQFAAAAQKLSPFEVCFDRVLSYSNKQVKYPVVLTDGSGGNNELMALHRELRVALGMGKSSFSPHITLLYDTKDVATESIERIHWMVDEVVLIRSEVGKTKYERLGRWRLGT